MSGSPARGSFSLTKSHDCGKQNTGIHITWLFSKCMNTDPLTPQRLTSTIPDAVYGLGSSMESTIRTELAIDLKVIATSPWPRLSLALQFEAEHLNVTWSEPKGTQLYPPHGPPIPARVASDRHRRLRVGSNLSAGFGLSLGNQKLCGENLPRTFPL